MIDETVESVMSGGVETVAPDAAAAMAAHALRDEAVGSLVVVADGEVVGIVAESDFVALVSEGADGTLPVSAFMSAPVVTVPAGASVVEAARTMRAEGVKTLPVVDDGALVGIVTATDLAHYLPRYRTEVAWKGDPLVAPAPDHASGRRVPPG